MPIEVITVPVTSGGKKRTMRDMKGAMSMPKKPAAMVAPKIPVMPTPGIPAIATMLPTAAKLAPIITGMRMPIGPMPSDWTRVAMPATSRSALIRKAISSRERPAAWPTIRGTATAPPYISSTCWKPTSSSCVSGRRWSTGESGMRRSVTTDMQHLRRFYCCQSQADTGKGRFRRPGISGRTSTPGFRAMRWGFISPLCARFNRFFVYKVIFVVDQSVYYRLSRAASTVSIELAPATPGRPAVYDIGRIADVL
ncbi:Uncharacterised protein [Pseudomonas aeruginosa]|nr:Uncharacterised protein [Pseudomonas aeruginosa]